MGLGQHFRKKGGAVIIKGNPKYLNDPAVKGMADAFYQRIEELLKAKGYPVEFDPGEPFTEPNQSASVWVAHSRGIDRLSFAADGIKTVSLQTNQKKGTNDSIGKDPGHYQLSTLDLANIAALPLYKKE